MEFPVENEDHPEEGFVDFGMSVFVLALAFGIVARTICGKRVKAVRLKGFLEIIGALPYTVWLLLFGVALGSIHLSNPDSTMASSISAWQNIDAHGNVRVRLPGNDLFSPRFHFFLIPSFVFVV